MSGPVFIFTLLAIILGWAGYIYNKLVLKKQMLTEALSGVEVQLERRSTLIPRLVETVKGYIGHESEVFEQTTILRSRLKDQDINCVKERENLEGELSQNIADILVTVENYPDLRADQSFLDLLDELINTENEIQMARRYYNGSVRDMNVIVKSFPSNIVANVFHFGEAEFFELESVDNRLPPEISFQLSDKA